MDEPLPLLNHDLIQSLAADVHALRAAVLAMAAVHPAPDQLLRHYDAATFVLLAKKQGEPSPDEYQDKIEQAIQGLRGMLSTTAGSPPGG